MRIKYVYQTLLTDAGASVTMVKDGKQIPIIAMTANAFEEDAKKRLYSIAGRICRLKVYRR